MKKSAEPVRSPCGLKDRFVRPSCNQQRLSGRHAVRAQLHHIKARSRPRHVGVIPCQKRQPSAVRRQLRRRVKIMPGRQHNPGLVGRTVIDVDPDEGVVRRVRTRAVILPHPNPAPAPHVDQAVGITPRALRRERIRPVPAAFHPVQPPVRIVREKERPTGDRPCPTAILVNAGAHVEGFGIAIFAVLLPLT